MNSQYFPNLSQFEDLKNTSYNFLKKKSISFKKYTNEL